LNEKVLHTKKLHREILKRAENGESYRSIEKDTQVSRITIRNWVKQGCVFEDGNENWHCPHCQKEFEHLLSLKLHIDVCKQNSNHRIYPTRLGMPHTESSKAKLSAARTKYLRENPQTHTYITLRNKESYPEKYFTEVFTNAGLNFQREVHCGTYTLDFYFQDFQVDFETDGEQHYTDERIIKSDRTRTEYLKSQNIETIRVRWSSFAKVKDENDKKEFIDSLIKDITNRQISEKTSAILYNLDLNNKITEYLVGKNTKYTHVIRAIGLTEKCITSVIKFIKGKGYTLNTDIEETAPNIKCEICSKCGKPKTYYKQYCDECCDIAYEQGIQRLDKRKFEISKEDLETLIQTKSYEEIGRIIGVSGNTIKKRCKLLKIDLSLAKYSHKKTKNSKETC
jgi:very-short-patch-repair endonuclease/transposase